MQATSGAGKDNGGVSTEARGRGEAQEESARSGMVGPGHELGDWRDGREQKIESMEEQFVLLAKGRVASPQLLNLVVCERCAPFKASGNDGVEFVEETGVDLRGFVSLKRRVDVPGLGPEGRGEGLELGRGALDAVLPELHRLKDLRLAALDHRSGEHADAGDGGRGWFGRQIEEGCGEKWQVAQIVAEPADGIERGSQVIAAGPVTDAERGSVAGQPAEGSGASHGAAGIGSDGGERGTFLEGGCRAAG